MSAYTFPMPIALPAPKHRVTGTTQIHRHTCVYTHTHTHRQTHTHTDTHLDGWDACTPSTLKRLHSSNIFGAQLKVKHIKVGLVRSKRKERGKRKKERKKKKKSAHLRVLCADADKGENRQCNFPWLTACSAFAAPQTLMRDGVTDLGITTTPRWS